jgi:sulfatase maturation enzyme AslB (radical SAM superfamily)
MHHIDSATWLRTSHDEPRGYVQPARLTELWFHTGTICNLACPFCLEGSKPGDDRIEQLRFDDARPFIDEALTLGVEQFSLTGGEPFVVRDTIPILAYALERRPCLVLTNATKPILKRLDDLLRLRDQPHPLRFRISIDYPDPSRHDAGRGAGTFELALSTAATLQRHGFSVAIARQSDRDEDRAAVDAAFLSHFARSGVRADTHIHSFPDFLTPGSDPDVPEITETCMTRHQDESTRDAFMCNYTKFVLKKDGRVRVYACTLVDDDPDYDLGATLAEAMRPRVMLRHHRCYACFAYGATCSDTRTP